MPGDLANLNTSPSDSPAEVDEGMLLNPGEQVLFSEQVDSDSDGDERSGTLYLTDHRLVFEADVKKSLFRAGVPRTRMDLNVEHVTNATSTSPTFGRPVLNVETDRGVVAYAFRTPNAGAWVGAITRARNARIAVLRAADGPASGRTEGAPGPAGAAPPTVYLHCRHCGTLNPAGRTRCTSCGATL